MHNETGGNIPEYEAALETAMQRYAGLGVHAVKTGVGLLLLIDT